MKARREQDGVEHDAVTVRGNRAASRVARRLFIAGLTAAWCGFSASGQETSGAPPVDYSSFRMITERNIFNANRSGRSVIRNEGPRYEPRVDSFSLVGIMSYEKGPFAFFDGTSSDYRKVLPSGGKIAGHTIAAVGVNQVRLETETNHLELGVGMQLRREDDGPWQLREGGESSFASSSSRSDSRRPDFGRSDSGRPDFGRSDSRRSDDRRSDDRRSDYRGSDSRSSRSSDSPRSSSVSSASTTKLSPEEESEILKKLMEQREKELQ